MVVEKNRNGPSSDIKWLKHRRRYQGKDTEYQIGSTGTKYDGTSTYFNLNILIQ
jgi:hypothetical protein